MPSLPYDVIFQILAIFWSYKFETYHNQETRRIAANLAKIEARIQQDQTDNVQLKRTKDELRRRDAKIRSERRWNAYMIISLVCKDWRDIIHIHRWRLIVLDTNLDRAKYYRMVIKHLSRHRKKEGSDFHVNLLRSSHIEANYHLGDQGSDWDTAICQHVRSAKMSAPRISWIFGSDRSNAFTSLQNITLVIKGSDSADLGRPNLHLIPSVWNLNLEFTIQASSETFPRSIGFYLKQFPNVEILTLSGATVPLYSFAPYTAGRLRTIVLDLEGLGRISLIQLAISASLRKGLFKQPSTDSKPNQIIIRGSRESPGNFELVRSNCTKYGVSLVCAPLR